MSDPDSRQEPGPAGHFEHDERGPAVYKANGEARTSETMMRMLRPEELSLLQEVAEAADNQYRRTRG